MFARIAGSTVGQRSLNASAKSRARTSLTHTGREVARAKRATRRFRLAPLRKASYLPENPTAFGWTFNRDGPGVVAHDHGPIVLVQGPLIFIVLGARYWSNF